MVLRDAQYLSTLIRDRRVSERSVARAAGYRSHSHVQRLRSGHATTVHTKAAARIAAHLGVSVEKLFRPGLSRMTQ